MVLVWRHNVSTETKGCIVSECNDRADSMFASSQWETSLQSNAVSHWLGAKLESALIEPAEGTPRDSLQCITWRHGMGNNDHVLLYTLNEAHVYTAVKNF